jgi:hypothetical protein
MPTIIDGTNGVNNIDFSEIATGTPDATNFLRGDGSWQVISTTPTTDQVLTATAGAAAGAVGSYAFLADGTDSSTNVTVGNTIAGSSLQYAGDGFNSPSGRWNINSSGTPSGTWRLLGFGLRDTGSGSARYASLFLRIS